MLATTKKGAFKMRFRSLLLKGCLLVIAVMTVGLAGGVLWRLPVRLLTFYHEPGFASLFGIGLLLGTGAILAACGFAWQLLHYVAKQQAFTQLAVTALARLKWACVGLQVGVCCLLPVFYQMADGSDAPGLMVIGLVLLFIPFVVSVFLAILQRLWQAAIDPVKKA